MFYDHLLNRIEDGEHFIDIFNEILDPVDNGFRHLKYKEMKKMDINEFSCGSLRRLRLLKKLPSYPHYSEVWTDSPCLFVNTDLI